ncbi:MAG: hypothetical protein AB7Y46_11250 [Armatimonadota bacterium]
MRNAFGRQAILMVWDYAECNPLSSSTGNWSACEDWVWKVVAQAPAAVNAAVRQLDAAAALPREGPGLVCTDPPYYDNIGYADLSGFFYVWLRRALGRIHPTLFSTLLLPEDWDPVADGRMTV